MLSLHMVEWWTWDSAETKYMTEYLDKSRSSNSNSVKPSKKGQTDNQISVNVATCKS